MEGWMKSEGSMWIKIEMWLKELLKEQSNEVQVDESPGIAVLNNDVGLANSVSKARAGILLLRPTYTHLHHTFLE